MKILNGIHKKSKISSFYKMTFISYPNASIRKTSLKITNEPKKITLKNEKFLNFDKNDYIEEQIKIIPNRKKIIRKSIYSSSKEKNFKISSFDAFYSFKKIQEDEESRKLLNKMREVKNSLIVQQKEFNVSNLRQLLQEVDRERLYYSEIFMEIEKIYAQKSIFFDKEMKNIAIEKIILGVKSKILKFSESTFIQIINDFLVDSKLDKISFTELHDFIYSLKTIENQFKYSGIQSLYFQTLMNHCKSLITEGKVIFKRFEDLRPFWIMFQNYREIFDNTYRISEGIWNNLNQIIIDSKGYIDIDLIVICSSLMTIYQQTNLNKHFSNIKGGIDIVTKRLICDIKNYNFLSNEDKYKIRSKIPNIIYFFLNFGLYSNLSETGQISNEIDDIIFEAMDIYVNNMYPELLPTSNIEIENLFYLGKFSERYSQYFEKIADFVSKQENNKFFNEQEEQFDLTFKIGKFVSGFSKHKVKNIKFWKKLLVGIKNTKVEFHRNGWEIKYLNYYFIQILRDEGMKDVFELFRKENIFPNETIFILRSQELCELFSDFIVENEFERAVKTIIERYKIYSNIYNPDQKLIYFIDLINIMSNMRRIFHISEVNSLIAENLVHLILSSPLTKEEIINTLNKFLLIPEIANNDLLLIDISEELYKVINSKYNMIDNFYELKNLMKIFTRVKLFDEIQNLRINYKMSLKTKNQELLI